MTYFMSAGLQTAGPAFSHWSKHALRFTLPEDTNTCPVEVSHYLPGIQSSQPVLLGSGAISSDSVFRVHQHSFNSLICTLGPRTEINWYFCHPCC